MAAPEMWTCPYDGKTIPAGGRIGHEISKVHQEAAALAGDGPGQFAEIPTAGEFSSPTDWDTALSVVPTEAELQEAIAGLKEELQESETARLRAESERDRYRPYVDVPFYTAPEDVIERYGLAAMRTMAEVQLAKLNKDRQKEGRPPIWSDNPALYQKQIDDLIDQNAAEMVQQQKKWVGEDPSLMIRMRTAKMVKRNGTMWQVPLDGTINNAAGSLADPVERYKQKGDKLAVPVRCMLRDCWVPRAERADGTAEIGGYCSEMHQQVMEGATRDRGDQRMTMLGNTATR